MHNIAFALDPDDYWVEIIAQNPVEQTRMIHDTNPATYRMNHTMIRVKDNNASLRFYQDVMGMNLKRTSENNSANFNLYFLGYGPHTNENGLKAVPTTGDREVSSNPQSPHSN